MRCNTAELFFWTVIFAVESLLIIVGNIITIIVFWKLRCVLKKTYCLLINLAVADLIVGFSAIKMVVNYNIYILKNAEKLHWWGLVALYAFSDSFVDYFASSCSRKVLRHCLPISSQSKTADLHKWRCRGVAYVLIYSIYKIVAAGFLQFSYHHRFSLVYDMFGYNWRVCYLLFVHSDLEVIKEGRSTNIAGQTGAEQETCQDFVYCNSNFCRYVASICCYVRFTPSY